jgi:hypothetical protein
MTGPDRRSWLTRRTATRLAAVAALASAALFSAIGPSPAEAIGTLNSECNPAAGGFVPIWLGSVAAQTFKAKSSGKLLTVAMKEIARGEEGTGGDINVVLYGTSGGIPIAPALASTSIPSASIPADNHLHDYTADFNPETAAYLTSGQTYAIALSTADNVQNVWFFAGEDHCPGVALFTGGPPFGYPLGHEDWDADLTTYLGPANDDFERAEELSGTFSAAEGTTAGGTRQPGEPDHYVENPPDSDLWKGDHTVWYRWTAPHNGATSIDTCIGEIDSILAVYTGNELASLKRVAENNNDPACSAHDVYGSKVSFEAIVGTTYDIVVGDAGGAVEKAFGLVLSESPDVTPPETQIDSGPSGPTTNASPAFTFSSSEPGVSFECRLDSNQEASFAPCASPKGYSSLGLGPHTFEVRAIDAAENIDATPASRSFTVEARPGGRSGAGGGSGTAAIRPDTIIDKVKISSAKDQATFRFASSDSIARFLCKIDRHPFRACTSPKTYRHLKPGKHRFQVEAVDAAGADPSPASRSLRIEPMK